MAHEAPTSDYEIAQGKDASDYEAQFAKVWAKADIQIRSSCLCQEGVATAK